MAATFVWCEDNGAATGSPARGTTRTFGVSQVNWKNDDSVANLYTDYPISAGNNSYTKYQFGVFSGSFTQITNVKFSHFSGVFGAGLTLKGALTSGYATPSASTNAALINDWTATGDIATGWNVYLSSGGPQTATGTLATLNATGYTAYIASQLQTTVAASAGNTTQVTLTIQYDEN